MAELRLLLLDRLQHEAEVPVRREPAEFAAGHAAGARNVPLATLDGAKGLPTNKALPLVLVCASGARSSRAAAELRKAGYASVHSLSGGTEAWRNASLPIEKSA